MATTEDPEPLDSTPAPTTPTTPSTTTTAATTTTTTTIARTTTLSTPDTSNSTSSDVTSWRSFETTITTVPSDGDSMNMVAVGVGVGVSLGLILIAVIILFIITNIRKRHGQSAPLDILVTWCRNSCTKCRGRLRCLRKPESGMQERYLHTGAQRTETLQMPVYSDIPDDPVPPIRCQHNVPRGRVVDDVIHDASAIPDEYLSTDLGHHVDHTVYENKDVSQANELYQNEDLSPENTKSRDISTQDSSRRYEVADRENEDHYYKEIRKDNVQYDQELYEPVSIQFPEDSQYENNQAAGVDVTKRSKGHKDLVKVTPIVESQTTGSAWHKSQVEQPDNIYMNPDPHQARMLQDSHPDRVLPNTHQASVNSDSSSPTYVNERPGMKNKYVYENVKRLSTNSDTYEFVMPP